MAIIIAAGRGTRWNNYLGRPKHFVEIDGEPIIKRTVRLARSYTKRLYVVASSQDYCISGTSLYVPTATNKTYGADKFLSSEHLWSRSGRTVVLYGDVYFTEAAMQHIMLYKPRQWALFARFGASAFTGKQCGECFAHSFYPEHIHEHTVALHAIIKASRQGKIERCGGWEHYRAMEGLPLREHKRKGRLVDIDDWTEDFDSPSDYNMWMSLRSVCRKVAALKAQ